MPIIEEGLQLNNVEVFEVGLSVQCFIGLSPAKKFGIPPLSANTILLLIPEGIIPIATTMAISVNIVVISLNYIIKNALLKYYELLTLIFRLIYTWY